MDIRIPVSICNLLVVYLRQPVIGRHSPGITQDQASHGVSDRGVLLHTPVLHLYIAVHDLLVVQDRRLHVPHLLPLLAIEDISLRHIRVPGLLQHLLHAVLDILHMNLGILDLILKIRRHTQRQQIDDLVVKFLLRGCKRLLDRFTDFT